MTLLEKLTGKTRVELEKVYIERVNDLMSLGINEDNARHIVKEAFKDTIKQLTK